MRTPAAIALPPRSEELKAVPRPVLVDTIARLIDHLDDREPDPDLEDDDPVEYSGDEHDYSVAGWARGRHGAQDENAEDDDPAEDDSEDRCVAADDDLRRRCDDGLPGDEADREEDDHSGDPLDSGEAGDCYGAHC